MSQSTSQWVTRIAIAAVAFTFGFLARQPPAADSPLDLVTITQQGDRMTVIPIRANTAVGIFSAADDSAPADSGQDPTEVKEGQAFFAGQLFIRLGNDAIPCQPPGPEAGSTARPGCTPIPPPKPRPLPLPSPRLSVCTGGADGGSPSCAPFESVHRTSPPTPSPEPQS